MQKITQAEADRWGYESISNDVQIRSTIRKRPDREHLIWLLDQRIDGKISREYHIAELDRALAPSALVSEYQIAQSMEQSMRGIDAVWISTNKPGDPEKYFQLGRRANEIKRETTDDENDGN